MPKKKPDTGDLGLPFAGEKFREAWEVWKDYKKLEHKFAYKSFHSESAALSLLVNLSDNNEATAIAIINQSIANGWKGFFRLKPEHGPHIAPPTGAKPGTSEARMRTARDW